MSVNEIKLKHVLKANALFSALSGSFLIVYRPLSELMQANPTTLMIVGGGLVIFAITVWMAAIRREVHHRQVWSIIIQDLIWVCSSLVVIAWKIWGLSSLGYWLIGFTAVVVMTFAWLQFRYLKRIAH